MSQYAIQLNKYFNKDSLITAFHSLSHIQSKPANYPGDGSISWNSITVYSLGGNSNDMQSYLPFISELNLSLRLVRFMVLEPGGVIKKHYDSFLSQRIVRLHIPVVTHHNVEFFLGDERCDWKAGELWYGDFTMPHYVVNNSDITRVHLVLDVASDENLLKLFPPHKVPSRLVEYLKDEEFDLNILKRFVCTFSLPSGFSLPGFDYPQLEIGLKGSIEFIDGELCVFINNQPMLKAMPVTEDKLTLVGLEHEAFVEYTFNGDTIKTLILDIAGNRIPVPLAEL